MYNTIKKLGLGFIFLNIFMLQSLKADMMFYYSAAILPSIAAQGQASPVCPPKTVLSDVNGVYNAIADNLSFVEQDGRRMFDTDLDNTKYVIDETFYTAVTPVSMMSPMYYVYYEDANTTYETRAELEIGVGNIESNMTWNWQEQRIENNNGVKTSFTEGDGGSWNFETDGSRTLSIGVDDIINLKPVRAISKNEINTILENAGIYLTLEAGDTAQLNIEKILQDWYWWADQSYIPATFDTLGDAIASAKYNSNNAFANIVLWGDRGNEGVGITFAENSDGSLGLGASGTLVEITNDNKLLSVNAGTWEIVEITDDDGTYFVIAMNPILCGYRSALGKLDANGYIIQGEHSDVAGEITANIQFSESLKDKLKAYFVDNAILDVTPPIAITQAMLDGKTFYSRYSDDVINAYLLRTEYVTGIFTDRVLVYDIASGVLIYDITNNTPYTIEGGLLKLETNGFTWFTLASETADQWNMIIEDDPEMDGVNGINTRSEIWFTSKPIDFPFELFTPTTTPITEAMLTGKTFYVDNGTDFEKVEILSPSEIQYTEISAGISHTGIVNYFLSNGNIVMDLGGDIAIFSLISSDSAQWNMFVNYSGALTPYRTWLLEEPAGFPAL